MRFVSYYPRAVSDASGVTEALWGWAAALVDAGHEVTVLHAGGERRSPDASHIRPGLLDREIPHRGSGRTTHRPVGLDRHLRPSDVLVLHEGWVMSNIVAARAARRVGAPYVVVPHGVLEPGIRAMLKPPRRLRSLVERSVLEHAAAIHTFFESEGPLVRAIAPRTPPLIVAPIGFDVGEERWVGGGGYLAWIGRYDPTHKGLDVLIDAVALLEPGERPVVELRGPDFNGGFARTRDQIARLGLEQWVHAEGPVRGDEKAEFLRQSDGYLMPSRWEGYGIALVENLAMGAPCLVSDAIHLAGPLAAANAAVLAPPTAEGLAAGLRRLAAADPAVLGDKGRSFVRATFGWPEVTAAFIAGVEQATGRRGVEAPAAVSKPLSS
jgi:glycosyltransferase involved in cell wall biosynthesis